MFSRIVPVRRRRFTLPFTMILLLLSAGVLWAGVAGASHGLVSLPGSNFEIDTDANLVVDHPPPSLDWDNVAEVVQADAPSGQLDDSFGEGTKEDDAVPTIVTGSIPPNKSDLLEFGAFQENGNFLHLFWSRVQDPKGTTNMDFEFNQSTTPSANGVTPVRTPGDLLITYDLAKGGTIPELALRFWTGSAWGAPMDLDASGAAAGSINTSPIPASGGLGPYDPRTFGEASIDLSVIFDPNECFSFGSAYLKSRASDSFTAALKDFIAPQSVTISNCGSLVITKVDDAGQALAGAEFTLYRDNAPVGGTLGLEDTPTDRVCTTDASGVCTITDVLVGDYWVVETVTPDGHDAAPPTAIAIQAGESVSLTLVDPRQLGAIVIDKTAKNASAPDGTAPLAGASFEIATGGQVVATTTTAANGQACVDGLVVGETYAVTETSAPTGYALADPATQSVTVSDPGQCGDGTEQVVSFVDTPLSEITISFTSLAGAGVTAATIECSGLTASPPDATPGLFDDASETFTDLLPGTYTCTMVIDP